MVEDVEEAVVEGQPGAEYRGQHHLIGRHAHLGSAERGGDIPRFVAQCLRNLVCLAFSYAHDVVAKQESVALIVLVPHFGHVLANDGVLL